MCISPFTWEKGWSSSMLWHSLSLWVKGSPESSWGCQCWANGYSHIAVGWCRSGTDAVPRYGGAVRVYQYHPSVKEGAPVPKHGSRQSRLTDSVQKGPSRLLCGPASWMDRILPGPSQPPKECGAFTCKTAARRPQAYSAAPAGGAVRVVVPPHPRPHGALIAAPFSRAAGQWLRLCLRMPRDAAAVPRPPHREGSGPGAAPSRGAALGWTWGAARASDCAQHGPCGLPSPPQGKDTASCLTPVHSTFLLPLQSRAFKFRFSTVSQQCHSSITSCRPAGSQPGQGLLAFFFFPFASWQKRLYRLIQKNTHTDLPWKKKKTPHIYLIKQQQKKK